MTMRKMESLHMESLQMFHHRDVSDERKPDTIEA